VNPRARRTADIAASVPEETRRTSSTDGHGVDDLRGEVDLALGRCAEGRPVAGRVADRLDGLGIGVAEDQRPPGLHPVEQAPPVGRLEVGALAACDEERLLEADGAHRAYRRVDAAGDQLLRAVPELRPD